MFRLTGARLVHHAKIARGRCACSSRDVIACNTLGAESTSDVMMGRRLAASHAIRAVELAMEAAGGAGFYRAQGLERRFRDVQGARYHPMQPGSQAEYAGAMATP